VFFIEKTTKFDKWQRKLEDLKAKAKILFRLQRIETDGHIAKAIGMTKISEETELS